VRQGKNKMGLIEVKNISHSFGDKALYSDASFELFKGEHMGLVGQNGTGKTTLLNSIIGQVIPDKGEIRRQNGIRVGYLDQHAKINGSVTIFEYLKSAFNDLYAIEEKLNKLYERMATDSSDAVLKKASNFQNTLEWRGFYQI
jgi:ATPase subunit of ABC transporter with duplicated ATPase domains